MCKRLISLTSLIMVLGFLGNVTVVRADTDWTGNASDGNWQTAGNWNNGLPDAADTTLIENATAITWPTLNGGTGVCGQLRIAYTANYLGELTVTGGATLNVGDELRIGRKSTNGSGHAVGILYISGETTTINVAERIACGRHGDATIDMSGGYLHSDAELRLAYREDGSGKVYLRGGTIDLDGNPAITVGNDDVPGFALIDISGGKMLLAGDQVSMVEGFVEDGTIIAYGGQSTVLVAYDPGDDVTIVTAVSLGKARDPSPDDEATDVCRIETLSWTAPDFVPPTNGHKVFFSEDINDVRDGIGGTIQSESKYIAGELDFGQTYYWRVDEANGAEWEQGDVWQFTTEPFGYPIAGITVTASSVGEPNEDMQPVNTVNGSGLDGDLHSADMTDMWLSVPGGGGGAGNASPSGSTGPAWIAYELPRLYKLHQMLVWNYNAFTNEDRGMRNVTIEYSVDGSEYTSLGSTHEFKRAPGADDYAANTTVDFNGVVAKYIVITAGTVDGNWGGDRYGLSEVRFLHIPMRAGKPDPGVGAADVPVDAVLTWKPGRQVQRHDVYFSTDEQAVTEGSLIPDSIVAAESCRTSYTPSLLELGKTYYWKVNEVNEADDPTTWEGDVWSFTIPDHIVVDDMETYTLWNFADNNIFDVWVDGMGDCKGSGNGTGVNVYPHFDESSGGAKSMKYEYDNDRSVYNPCTNMPDQPRDHYYSEASAHVADLPSGIGADWSAGGAKALSLWFYGDPNNDVDATEQMYVKVNGVKVEYDGDMDDIRQAWWHEWNIDLASFTGVDLKNVTQISIGFGNENNTTTPGGSGTVYFDEIRLYPTRCVLSKRPADFARADYAGGDCFVDHKEFVMMGRDWHEADFSASPLMAWWKFDGDATDSSGNERNGTVFGDPIWATGDGKIGDALNFDGENDYVNIDGYKGVVGGKALTITAWIRARDNGEIVGWGGESGIDGARVEFRVNNDRLRYEIGGGNVQGETIVSDSQWHHAAVTVIRNATASYPDAIIYLDGVDNTIYSTDTAVSNAPAVYDVQIGHRYDDSGSRRFTGDIDDLRIYDKVLSQAEIVSIVDGSLGTVSEYHPIGLPTELYDAEPENSRSINALDLAEMANWWLEGRVWP